MKNYASYFLFTTILTFPWTSLAKELPQGSCARVLMEDGHKKDVAKRVVQIAKPKNL